MKLKKGAPALLAGIVILTGCKNDREQKITAVTELSIISFANSVVQKETGKIPNKPTGINTNVDVLEITEFGEWERDGAEYFEGEVTTLKDYRWFTNLKGLHLQRCDVHSLEGIEELKELETLIVRNNRIQSIELVKNLTNLVTLEYADKPMSDYSPISVLTKLEWLCIER